LFWLQFLQDSPAVPTSKSIATNRVRTRRQRPLPIDDTRITDITSLSPPSHLLREFPAGDGPCHTTYEARQAIHRVLHGGDDRLLVVVGPARSTTTMRRSTMRRACRLKHELTDRLIIVMRVYFEKPRTDGRAGRASINDPRLDDSFRINEGLRPRAAHPARDQRARPARRHRVSRHDHAAVHRGPDRVGAHRRAHHGEPGASPACVGPVVSGRIQERHQWRREIAVDAIKAASAPHHFLSVTKGGHSAIVHTGRQRGLPHHPARRQATNYDAASVEAVCQELAHAGLAARVMIDCSHANSQKQHERQVDVARDIAGQIAGGDARISA
jgi:3-deoxy-7-phosphoheptulonate synthase